MDLAPVHPRQRFNVVEVMQIDKYFFSDTLKYAVMYFSLNVIYTEKAVPTTSYM